MRNPRLANLRRILLLLVVGLILKVTFSIVLGYRNYIPPNFDVDFLSGRQSYFAGVYQWAFYSHIVSGPLSLILGLILISESFRKRFPKWHRSMGKVQAGVVLFLLAPSGLWMAYYAQTGAVAGIGFSLLAIAAGMCVLAGWRAAVKKRFAEHRRWMLRCFLLLCSAVIVRIIGGLATVAAAGDSWIYPLAAWASWLVPLAAFEFTDAIRRHSRQADIRGERRSAASPAALSLRAMEVIAPQLEPVSSSSLIFTRQSHENKKRSRARIQPRRAAR
jgi:uncharacterized membrane protein YozB (DUF420 family)